MDGNRSPTIETLAKLLDVKFLRNKIGERGVFLLGGSDTFQIGCRWVPDAKRASEADELQRGTA